MSTTGHENEAINVSGLKASLKKGGNIGIYNEAICSTAGGTAAKVTNTTPPSFTLTAGAKILVKFTYAISAENATLQVGSSTAKPIYYKGAALPADIVKAGTSVLLQYDGTSFNIVGDINTDTTYSVMGASGSTHSGGLVPDTPSTAGTTKFLREDGTWREPAGQNYSAGDGIDISNNEISADNTIARKTDLAPAKLGSGIGTCSTSSGTALEVVLSDYNLVQNGFVAVTFANDVPAGATLNVNSKGAKPIYYKGSAIEADTIKADDTVMFCYNGSQYVVTSLGGGGAVAMKETAIITLSQQNGNNADLIGATIVVTDSFTSDTLLSTTWQGTDISLDIDVNTVYTVTVGSITGYITPAAQSYKALPTLERDVNFMYNSSIGAYIEATDGTLYSSTNWSSSGKVANSVVLLTSTHNMRIALVQVKKPIHSVHKVTDVKDYIQPVTTEDGAKADFNGATKTNGLIQYNKAKGTYTTDYAAPWCESYRFPDFSSAHMPAGGEFWLIAQNKTQIGVCLTACGGDSLATDVRYWTCTLAADGTDYSYFWDVNLSNNTFDRNLGGMINKYYVRPVADYSL